MRIRFAMGFKDCTSRCGEELKSIWSDNCHCEDPPVGGDEAILSSWHECS